MFELVNIFAVFVATVSTFLFGWLWYSKFLFGNQWMTSVGKTTDQMMANKKEMPRVMAFGFFITFITNYALAVMFAVIAPGNIVEVLGIALFLCFAFVVTTKFTELIYQSREPHWSRKPQMLFLISSGYHLGSFVISALVLWFFMNGMSL